MKNKKPSISKYIFISVGIFTLSIIFSIIARRILMVDGMFIHFDESQVNMIICMIEGAVGAIAAGFVLYQLKIGDTIEEQQSGIDEARFILQFNQSFIQDQNMSEIERQLERCGVDKKIPYDELITEDNRQSLINYLVYLESLAPFVLQGIIKLEHIDDLMAYRFFLAVNNSSVQKDQLFSFPDYYRGCFKLYAMWRDYRLMHDRKILLSDTALDRWHHFEAYASNAVVKIREVNKKDDKAILSHLIYETDGYIYPALFGNKKNAEIILPRWLNENVIFNRKNILAAVIDDKIVGVMLTVCRPDFDELPKQVRRLPKIHRESYSDAVTNYFNHISEEVFPDESIAYVMCLSIDAAYRGWCIGEKLLNNYISQHPHKKIVLDVLADNPNAIRLYEKCGFEISGEERTGYAFKSNPPICYRMVRQQPKE